MSSRSPPANSNRPEPALPADLPEFPVYTAAPDFTPFLAGNTGIRGFTTRNSGRPGPHVVLMSLMHGNELAGAIVITELLRQNFMPLRGRVTMGFANIEAFARFDPTNPLASRFVEEDLNRVWDDSQLFGVRRSLELDRAREMRPIIDEADLLLDLHSMLWPSDPLLLCGPTAHGRHLAQTLATPHMVIADHGHAGGKRLIDYGHFTAAVTPAAAILVEAGQHWEPGSVVQTRATVQRLLSHAGMIAPCPAPRRMPVFAQVTRAVTARTNRFVFTHAYRGGEIVRAANSLIAHDGDEEIRTPYDDCLLVMPSLHAVRGHTAIRLARLV
ncbi:MAG TPA: succinylglutamate desuccinylase/aspartoacylase family protein [Acidocella sp.]|jgi:predicted deacylase|uniref:succinylglutamate desuccinylase/aspartoacylase domain-containing protein n=1 Tax=Acidocella sp. TaxID=50710 RepID=UPI002CF01E48|nr:succinylglutamate desuccinylase/aspartoacylase family protein [Acidocella sp.]HVE20887.1 succinylglutamate desuccinylase/aspartoacylase family protein [Acidocella sp.]